MKKGILFGVLALTVGVLAIIMIDNNAHAAQETATFQVTASVLETCTLTANDLDFGDYDHTAGNKDATTTIDVNCISGTAWELKLSAGNSGDFSQRHMLQGVDTLNYNLYTSVTHTTIWDDGTGGPPTYGTATGTGNSAVQTQTVYGLLPGDQNVPPGTYTDTITVTLEY